MAEQRRIQVGRLGIGHVMVDAATSHEFKILGLSRTGRMVTIDTEVGGQPITLPPLDADAYVLVVER